MLFDLQLDGQVILLPNGSNTTGFVYLTCPISQHGTQQ